MKTTNGNGNGQGKVGRFTTEVIDDNPYLQRSPADNTPKPSSGDEDLSGSANDSDDDAAAVEIDDRQIKVRRRFAIAAVAALFLVAIISALAFFVRSSTRVEYGKSPKQSAVMPPPPNGTTTPGRDTRTEQAIEEAQRLTSGSDQNSVVAGMQPRALPSGTPQMARSPEIPFTSPESTGFGTTVKSSPNDLDTRTNSETSFGIQNGSGANAATTPSPDVRNTIRSQRSSETSIYMADPGEVRAMPGPSSSRERKIKTVSAPEKNIQPTILPAFGSMLPVRTIGALYTLRTGALVRLELTRDMKGNGWSMKRGAIIVGTTKGSGLDRAYVTILGFIDPLTGKLVKLGGEVRGGDGGEGLRGKRKQLDGGWSRALGLLGGAALDVTGSLLTGRSRDTVVISDGLRTRTINPLTEEVSGVLGGELNRRQTKGFVQVLAGTPGYVMVTDLPAIIRGTEAIPELDDKALTLLTDVDVTRPATGLSEHELAELLANGSPEEIRAAIPRMTSAMRKIAVAVLPP